MSNNNSTTIDLFTSNVQYRPLWLTATQPLLELLVRLGLVLVASKLIKGYTKMVMPLAPEDERRLLANHLGVDLANIVVRYSDHLTDEAYELQRWQGFIVREARFDRQANVWAWEPEPLDLEGQQQVSANVTNPITHKLWLARTIHHFIQSVTSLVLLIWIIYITAVQALAGGAGGQSAVVFQCLMLRLFNSNIMVRVFVFLFDYTSNRTKRWYQITVAKANVVVQTVRMISAVCAMITLVYLAAAVVYCYVTPLALAPSCVAFLVSLCILRTMKPRLSAGDYQLWYAGLNSLVNEIAIAAVVHGYLMPAAIATRLFAGQGYVGSLVGDWHARTEQVIDWWRLDWYLVFINSL